MSASGSETFDKLSFRLTAVNLVMAVLLVPLGIQFGWQAVEPLEGLALAFQNGMEELRGSEALVSNPITNQTIRERPPSLVARIFNLTQPEPRPPSLLGGSVNIGSAIAVVLANLGVIFYLFALIIFSPIILAIALAQIYLLIPFLGLIIVGISAIAFINASLRVIVMITDTILP